MWPIRLFLYQGYQNSVPWFYRYFMTIEKETLLNTSDTPAAGRRGRFSGSFHANSAQTTVLVGSRLKDPKSLFIKAQFTSVHANVANNNSLLSFLVCVCVSWQY